MKWLAKKWRRALVPSLLVSFVLATLLGVYAQFFHPNVYSTGFSFFVLSMNEDKSSPGTDVSLLADLRAIVREESFRETAQEKAGQKLPAAIWLRQPKNSHLMELMVCSTSPEEAQSLCAALGEELVTAAKEVLHASYTETRVQPVLNTVPLQRGGLFLGCGALVVFYLLSLIFSALFVRAVPEEEPTEAARLPLLATLPGSDPEAKRYLSRSVRAKENPGPLVDVVSEEMYQAVLGAAQSLDTAMPAEKGIVLAVTAPQQEEGQDLFAALLAQTLTLQGRQVLLLDLSGRGECAAYMNVNPQLSLSSLYRGQARLNEVLTPVPGLQGLYFISRGDPLPEGERFGEWLRAFLDSARTPLDEILVNLPPLSGKTPFRLAAFADDCLLYTHREREAAAVAARLAREGNRPAWLVLSGNPN